MYLLVTGRFPASSIQCAKKMNFIDSELNKMLDSAFIFFYIGIDIATFPKDGQKSSTRTKLGVLS